MRVASQDTKTLLDFSLSETSSSSLAGTSSLPASSRISPQRLTSLAFTLSSFSLLTSSDIFFSAAAITSGLWLVTALTLKLMMFSMTSRVVATSVSRTGRMDSTGFGSGLSERRESLSLLFSGLATSLSLSSTWT